MDLDSEIVGDISYDKKSYNQLEGSKKVLDGIVCVKIMIPKYTPKYTKIFKWLKDEIINKNYDFDQGFALPPLLVEE